LLKTTKFPYRLSFRSPGLRGLRYWRVLICAATALSAASCEHHVRELAAIEARVIREEGCSDCYPVQFRNPYSNEESVLVRAEPDFVLPKESIARVNMLRIDNQIEGLVEWKAEILLTAEAHKRALSFGAGLGPTEKLLLISMAEQPIDVIMSDELGGLIRIGSFDSIADFRSSFPTAASEEIPVVLERSVRFDEMNARFEAATKRIETTAENFDALIEALDAGDEEKAVRIQSELAKQKNWNEDVNGDVVE
jgi:hypothetical protein